MDHVTIVPAGTPGFDPFRRFRERRDLERQLADLTRGDLAAMMACSLAVQGIACGVTPTAQQQQLIERIRQLRGANPYDDFESEARRVLG